MINPQSPEAFEASNGAELDLHSIWHTLQGEGPFSGAPAIFIRLAGCNLQCPFCDTEYTQGRQRVKIQQIVERVVELRIEHPRTHLVVITGGEPTRQNIDVLVFVLRELKFHIQIESNGVLAPSQDFLSWVINGGVSYVVSPKTARICPQTRYASAFKYVLAADSIREEDGLPLQALGHKAKPFIARPPANFSGIIYLNPMDASDPVANRANLLACRDSALKFGYNMGLQLHKIVGVD